MNEMNELIKVNYEKEQPSVSGRELHEFLEDEEKNIAVLTARIGILERL